MGLKSNHKSDKDVNIKRKNVDCESFHFTRKIALKWKEKQLIVPLRGEKGGEVERIAANHSTSQVKRR